MDLRVSTCFQFYYLYKVSNRVVERYNIINTMSCLIHTYDVFYSMFVPVFVTLYISGMITFEIGVNHL